MSTVVTEIATLHANDALKADPSLFDDLAQVVTDGAKRHAIGLLRQTSGRRIEEPGIWQWFLDWESLEQNKRAREMLSNDENIKEKVARVTDSGIAPAIVYVPFAPYQGLTKALAAPVTEVAFARLKDTTDSQEFKAIAEATLDTSGDAAGCLSLAWGYSIEDEKVAVFVVGWESIEAHEKASKTELFRSLSGPFFEAISEIKMFHIEF